MYCIFILFLPSIKIQQKFCICIQTIYVAGVCEYPSRLLVIVLELLSNANASFVVLGEYLIQMIARRIFDWRIGGIAVRLSLVRYS
jgi:hypothetical protein